MAIQTSDNKWSVTNYMVDPVAGKADFTTISDACAFFLANAITGVTCSIKSGTYTEDVASLAPGITYTALGGSQITPSVTISGKVTMTATGTSTIYGINLQTNGDYSIEITGSNDVNLVLHECNFTISDNTAINVNNANSNLTLRRCRGNVSDTGITLYSITSISNLIFDRSHINNSGNSTTISDCASGTVQMYYVVTNIGLSSSGTASYSIRFSLLATQTTNTICFTKNSNSTIDLFIDNTFRAGTGKCLQINSGSISLVDSTLVSTSTPVIDGSGTINYTSLSFVNNSGIGGTTTMTPLTSREGDILSNSISFDGGTNTLSYYEEGNFTPVVEGASTAGVTSYSSRSGRYVRIGRMLFIDLNAAWTNATGTGVINITGLPSFNANLNAPLAIQSSIAVSTSTSLFGTVLASTNTISVKGSISNTGATVNSSLAANTNAFIYLSGSYAIAP